MVSPQSERWQEYILEVARIVHELYERPTYKRTLPSESFVEKPCVVSQLPTELEALRESSELTVKTQTVEYVNITSNWISEIQQCF